VPVAVLRDGKQVLAVQLDAIEGQREVIVKHPGAQLAQVPGLAGATLLSDGGIALIIDPFRLPAVAADAQPASPVSAAPVVLVVDDSLTVRRASQRLLERHGYTVVLARDGIEALERLHQQCPAAVLLDIEMPRMDGFELLATLREEVRFRSLPVVMITSRIAERHRERAALLGATAYMGKPFEETALLALLSQVCTAQTALA
jgi:chemosensory pili system protein ChpA (sensor histidine kinase/response regulator)